MFVSYGSAIIPIIVYFGMTHRVSEFYITCHLWSWDLGGRATNSLSHAHNMGVSHGRYHANEAMNSTHYVSTISIKHWMEVIIVITTCGHITPTGSL